MQDQNTDNVTDKGWISVYRKSLDNPVISRDVTHLGFWVYLLLKATHKPLGVIFDGKRITLQPGQFITSRKTLMDETRLKGSRIERFLKSLEIEHQIGQLSSTKNRLITITNWDRYQKIEHQKRQQADSKRTASGQQADINNNENNENNVNKRVYTLGWVKEHRNECVTKLRELYPEKDAERAYDNFVEQNEIKSYKYKNYFAALKQWTREDRFSQFSKASSNGVRANGTVAAPKGKYDRFKI